VPKLITRRGLIKVSAAIVGAAVVLSKTSFAKVITPKLVEVKTRLPTTLNDPIELLISHIQHECQTGLRNSPTMLEDDRKIWLSLANDRSGLQSYVDSWLPMIKEEVRKSHNDSPSDLLFGPRLKQSTFNIYREYLPLGQAPEKEIRQALLEITQQ